MHNRELCKYPILVLLGGNKRMIIISNQPLLSQSWISYSPNTASLFAKEETVSLFLSSVCLWPQTHLQIFYNLVFLADIPGKALTVGRSPKSTEMEASGFVIDCQQQRQMLGFMYNRNCQTKRMIPSYLLRQLKKKILRLAARNLLKAFFATLSRKLE